MSHALAPKKIFALNLPQGQLTATLGKDKNRDRLAQRAKIPPKPGQEEIQAKLQAWKAKLGLMLRSR